MRFTYFILLTLTLLACTEEKKRTRVLPMLGNYDLEYKTIDGEKIVYTLFHKIPVFTFLNEDSILKTNSDFKNKVWITEFFFSTCPTICPAMNSQLKKLNTELQAY